MRRLLHINASPRGARSRSGAISAQVLAGLTSANTGLSIETIDLFDADLPPFDAQAIEGRYGLLMGTPVPPEQAAAWGPAAHDGGAFPLVRWVAVLGADVELRPAYRLKHYIDCITHPGMTFRNDAAGNVEGLAAGRTAIIVAASAMPFGSMPAIEGLDFQLSYLNAWLGFIGVTDIHAVRVAGTFGPEDAVAAAMAKAATEADALVAQLSARAAEV